MPGPFPPTSRHGSSNIRFLNYMAACDMARTVCPAYCPPIHRHAFCNLRLLNYLASCDVASNIWQTLGAGVRRGFRTIAGQGCATTQFLWRGNGDGAWRGLAMIV
jgi:hypothetical protein